MRTITIDGIGNVRIQLTKGVDGALQVFAEYELRSGSHVIQLVQKDVTSMLGSGRRTAAQGLLDQMAQDISGIELT